MIKLFRNIRKKLLQEGKTSKYLKYAIGEIILVVIGILIALSINNWNEYRKERKEETKVLEEIYANLEKDYNNLHLKIEATNGFKKANSRILKHLESKTPLTDSIRYFYAQLQGFGTFRPITAGYENLRSKGVDIVQNDSLRSSISELYDFKYFFFVEDLTYAIADFKAEKTKFYHDRIFLDKGIFVSGEPYDLETLQNDEKFKGFLKSTLVVHDFMNSRRTKGVEQIKEVMNMINAELTYD